MLARPLYSSRGCRMTEKQARWATYFYDLNGKLNWKLSPATGST
ncbi:MAG: hypothetical protein WKG07_08480 [Hymenobacter sp.]